MPVTYSFSRYRSLLFLDDLADILPNHTSWLYINSMGARSGGTRCSHSEPQSVLPSLTSYVFAAKVDDLLSHLKRVSAEHEASLEANETAQESIRELQSQIHDQTATIRALRRERGSVPGLGDNQNRRAA